MIREISVSEAGRLFDCEQQWDFAYGGHSAGSTLRPKETKMVLREGRAWGAAVAAWHATGQDAAARVALHSALEDDAEQLRAQGTYDETEADQLAERIHQLIDHYTAEAERVPLFDAERRFSVPLPSRGGRRRSNRYGFVGFVDGLAEINGRLWIVEFKLRRRLSTFEQVAWARQVRWYAWAVEQQVDAPVAGVIVDERLNEVPKAPRVLKSGKPSHAKDQLCTAKAYRRACEQADEPVDYETFDHLAARRWQERHRVLLRRDEIERAGQQLVSTAQLIADLDTGRRAPVPNPSQHRCPGCQFREVCGREHDQVLIDALYERTVPKRNREEITT